jgi:HAD superfamily hydrolase (TIGR01484 family)
VSLKYKLVVLDMDGTLLDNNNQVSAKNKAAINRLLKNDINIILASGRPFDSIHPFVEDLGFSFASNSSKWCCY